MRVVLAGSMLVCLWGSAAAAADEPAGDNAKKYTLRYKFHPGETIRWSVEHRSRIRTSVSGTTKTAETDSRSVKVWRVTDVRPDGTATFEHAVEDVRMRQKLTGCEEARYDSRTDQQPPQGFGDVAESVGVTLAVITLAPDGKLLKRERKQVKAGRDNEGQMTIPLPAGPIGLGERWSQLHDVDVKLNSGAIKRVKTLQSFELMSVKTGVAKIRVRNQILTPIDDPALESQLIQRESSGTVRFDVDAGRVLSQRMDVDKRVVGFRGPASSLHCVTRFTEELAAPTLVTASR